MAKKILIVGHCGIDGPMLQDVMGRIAPGIEAQRVNDMASLESQADAQSLLLVNRVLEGRFPTHNGIDLIAELARKENAPRLMLISNHTDAQKQAQAAGAIPGFGKARAHARETADLILQALEDQGQAAAE
jgi:hypothetical protein